MNTTNNRMLIVQCDIYALWRCLLSAVSASSYSGSVCFRFCSDGKCLQRAHLTAERVWQTGSLWVGQVWGEYCETVGWKAALLPWLLTSSILLKFSPRRTKSEEQLPECSLLKGLLSAFSTALSRRARYCEKCPYYSWVPCSYVLRDGWQSE